MDTRIQRVEGDQVPAKVSERSTGVGLTSAEAASRLWQYGPNLVAEAPPRQFAMLARKFWGVIPWMLEFALILDLVLRRWVEAVFVGMLLVLNAALAFRQESKATKALALLRQRLTINARVERDGRWQVLPAAQIVPGDLLHLRAGDIVPADMRLGAGELLLDQSVLTGESLPVEHHPGSTAFSGSLVRRGEASGIVTSTGSRTYFGKAAELVRLAAAPPRLERLVVGITKYLAALDIALAAAVLAVALAQGRPAPSTLLFMVMLLIASIPVALPVMFTMSAAMGARMLAEKGVLTTRLAAIEDAAAMNVLCLDKTGTLTENRLAVEAIAPANSKEALRLAALASDEATQDPIDLAILEAARARGLVAGVPRRLSFTPFDPSTKRSEALIREGGQSVRVIKGEPATVAELARRPWQEIAETVRRLSANGGRVLAVAAGSGDEPRIAGLIALSDPLRADTSTLVEDLGKRGVRLLLVTGDGEVTAQAVAAKAGITGELAPAGTIRENMDVQAASRFSIFARVLPEDKFFLVQALQKAGHVVGMTGDGVNDAPALRQADVGIAVAAATDVAKAAASLILTKPGLGEIVLAIDASRRIYQRMQTFVTTLLTRKMMFPLFLSLGVLVLNAFVISPLMVVLFMITTDVATLAVSTDQVTASPTPDHWAIRSLMATAVSLSVPLLLMSGAVYWAGAHTLHLGDAKSQSLVFLWLVFATSQGVLYLTRARRFMWNKPHPGRWLNLATLALVATVVLMAVEGWLIAPLSPFLATGTVALAFVFLLAMDLLKVAVRAVVKSPVRGSQP